MAHVWRWPGWAWPWAGTTCAPPPTGSATPPTPASTSPCSVSRSSWSITFSSISSLDPLFSRTRSAQSWTSDNWSGKYGTKKRYWVNWPPTKTPHWVPIHGRSRSQARVWGVWLSLATCHVVQGRHAATAGHQARVRQGGGGWTRDQARDVREPRGGRGLRQLQLWGKQHRRQWQVLKILLAILSFRKTKKLRGYIELHGRPSTPVFSESKHGNFLAWSVASAAPVDSYRVLFRQVNKM